MEHTIAPRAERILVVIIKLVIVLIPIWVAFSLVNNRYLFTPTVTYSYQPESRIGVIRPVAPASLIRSADAGLRWRMTTDRFGFTIGIPRLLQAVRVDVKLARGTQPYVDLTAAGRDGVDRTSILYAQALEQLDWSRVSHGRVTLWSRQPQSTYPTVDSFLAKPPDPRRVAVVGFDRMGLNRISNDTYATSQITIPHTFRGTHRLYVYVGGEALSLHFNKNDLNRIEGKDELGIRITPVKQVGFQESAPIFTSIIPDDGDADNSTRRGGTQRAAIDVAGIPAGIYRIDVVATEDVVFSNIISAQNMLAFDERVWLAEGPAYGEKNFLAMTVAVNGTKLGAAANHDQGQQELLVGTKKLLLEKVKALATIDNLAGTSVVRVAKGDAILTTDGLLAISPAKLLPSGAKLLDVAIAQPDLGDVDFVLAEYVPNGDAALSFSRTYPLRDLELKAKDLSFTIHTPGLASSSHTIALKEIRTTFFRGPFPWGKIPDKFRQLFRQS